MSVYLSGWLPDRYAASPIYPSVPVYLPVSTITIRYVPILGLDVLVQAHPLHDVRISLVADVVAHLAQHLLRVLLGRVY